MEYLNLSFVQAVNVPGEPNLTRADVYAGLVALAKTPAIFTEYILGCDFEDGSNHFRRSLIFKDASMAPPHGRLEQEVVLTPGHKLECTTLATGNKVTNVIHEDIAQDGGTLSLSIEYNIPAGDVKPGSEEEHKMMAKYTAQAKRNLSSGIKTMREMATTKSQLN